MIKRLLLASAALVCAAPAWAGAATVTGASVRATAPGQDSAAVSLRISARHDARLVAVSSPAAARVEIHLMKHEDGMMIMRQVEDLVLPANQEVVLGSGSHLMLVGLKRPLMPGDRIQLSLTVEYTDKRRETTTVSAEVRPLASSQDMHDGTGGDKAGHDMGEHHMGSHDH